MAAELSNRMAPEHLELCVSEPDKLAKNIKRWCYFSRSLDLKLLATVTVLIMFCRQQDQQDLVAVCQYGLL